MAKQYLSVIRLFEHCGIASNDDFNLPRARKQLQAEFGIAQSGFIEAGGYSYTLQDVFEELNHPDFLNRLLFHKQLWSRPQMLQLLENNTADFGTLSAGFEPFWNNKKFDEFFSPYFSWPFNYLSRTLLNTLQLSELTHLLAYQGFLLPADREEAFLPLRLFLEEDMRLLRNTNGDNYKVMRPNIVHWVDEEWHTLFNALPDDFDDVKNRIITRLINIGVAIQKTFRRDCRKISGQLILLHDTPESLRTIIISNHTIYNKSRFAFKGRSVFWGIWIIVAFIRMIGSDGCSGLNNEPKYKIIQFKKMDTSTIKILNKQGFKMNEDSTAGVLKYQE